MIALVRTLATAIATGTQVEQIEIDAGEETRDPDQDQTQSLLN